MERFAVFADLVAHLVGLGVEVIGVDMPLNPPELGQRLCDIEVREALGGFGSSLFVTPTRAALAAPTQTEASRINRERGGMGVSSQAFALRHKIAEIAHTQSDVPLIEVHPELTFHLLGPALYRKRSWAGVRERVRLLRAQGLHPDEWECGNWAAADDTIDAAAAALSARRHALGEAKAFGDLPGDPVIWA